MPTPLDIAQRAEVMATAAATQINAHERECARRYNEVASQFSDMREMLEEIKDNAEKRFRTAIGGILTIVGMGAVQILMKILHIG